jgi:hypothetical protein
MSIILATINNQHVQFAAAVLFTGFVMMVLIHGSRGSR